MTKKRPAASLPFDDADRPRAPRHPKVSMTGRRAHGAQALRMIHDHLRHEMAQVVRAVEAAARDARRAGDARALIQDLTMGTNFRALGSFCGRYCQVVDVHHRIEDASMFPDLARADPALRPVLNRLSAEHVTIHDVLVELDAALVAMLTEQEAAIPRVQAAARALNDGLLDHLDYEERELLPALARLGLAV